MLNHVKSKKVLLIHGLWEHLLTMHFLAKCFKSIGYEVGYFNYHPYASKKNLEESFIGKVNKFKPDVIVGHSMGGVIAVRHINKLHKSVDKIVCLGSPLKGSIVAKKIVNSISPYKLFGEAAIDWLTSETVIPETEIRILSVSGTNNYCGFWWFLSVLGGISDGTVSKDETFVKGVTHTASVHAGHMDLITSAEVISIIVSFLEDKNVG